MHKFALYKVFKVKDIPKDLVEGFKLKGGQSMMLIVNIEKQSNKLDLWLYNHGAGQLDKVFIFNE